MKHKTNNHISKNDTKGHTMKGADVLVAALEKEGVDVVFAYPGGASMELHQALTKSQKIRTILPRFEQGGGFMAHGYALVWCSLFKRALRRSIASISIPLYRDSALPRRRDTHLLVCDVRYHKA